MISVQKRKKMLCVCICKLPNILHLLSLFFYLIYINENQIVELKCLFCETLYYLYTFADDTGAQAYILGFCMCVCKQSTACWTEQSKAELHTELPSSASTLLLPLELWSALPPHSSLSFPSPWLRQAGKQGRWYPSKQNDPGVPAPCFDPAVLIVQA